MDKWVCEKCRREFTSAGDAYGHLEGEPRESGWHPCPGTIRRVPVIRCEHRVVSDGRCFHCGRDVVSAVEPSTMRIAMAIAEFALGRRRLDERGHGRGK